MQRNHFQILALLSVTTLLTLSAYAQSNVLANRLTVSDTTSTLGTPTAISGDTVVVGGTFGTDESCIYVFERPLGGWSSETPTAKLTSSDGVNIGRYLAIGDDTVYATADNFGAVYVFTKPAGGWKDMHETAKLTHPNDSGFAEYLALDADTLVVNGTSAAYVYVKPASGWINTTPVQATLAIPNSLLPLVAAVSGGTVAVSSTTNDSSGEAKVTNAVYVYQKPSSGWAGTIQPSAKLARVSESLRATVGNAIAIYGDTIAASVSPYTNSNGSVIGSTPRGIDLFVKPSTGWANATENVELIPPPSERNDTIGENLVMNSSHLIAGSPSGLVYAYSIPAGGWGAFEWPSQLIAGPLNVFFGFSVALDGDTTVIGAPLTMTNPSTGIDDGAAYVYTLQPNAIHVSTNFLEFPDTNFGTVEKLSLTVTNSGTGPLSLATSMDSPNYQVLQSEENTCLGGVPAGQSCVLPIEFNPPAVGQHTNNLTLTSAASSALRVIQMRGLAAGVGSASESPLVFTTQIGTSQKLPLVIANFGVSGSPTVAVSFNNPSFSLASAGNCAAGVPERQTCTMMIKFAPPLAGSQNGLITLTPSSGAPSVVKVSGSTY